MGGVMVESTKPGIKIFCRVGTVFVPTFEFFITTSLRGNGSMYEGKTTMTVNNVLYGFRIVCCLWCPSDIRYESIRHQVSKE